MNILKSFFARRRRYNDLSASIREHIEDYIKKLMEAGIVARTGGTSRTPRLCNVDRIEQRSHELREPGSRNQLNRNAGRAATSSAKRTKIQRKEDFVRPARGVCRSRACVAPQRTR